MLRFSGKRGNASGCLIRKKWDVGTTRSRKTNFEPKMHSTKRKYHRRSDEERIADLEQRITELKAKQALRDKKEDPVLREIPKVQKHLRKFAQLAMDNNRPDISNSTWAFSTGLDRILRSEISAQQTRPTPPIIDI